MLAAILAAACGYRVPHSRIRVPDAHACHIRMQTAPPAADGGEVLLSASGLAQTFDGQRYPFRDIELTLARGAKVGLVGANGVGKSSLLKVLVGADAPESGDVRLTKDVQLAYVEQDPTLPDGALAEEFFYGSELPGFAALREFGAAAAEVEEGGDDAAAARLARASDAMDERAWALESEMKKLCEVLRVRSLLRTPASALSGGQRKRLALAAALLARPDLLLLDEPTNHLDIEGIGWLEKELSSMRDTAVLLVTHDRAFLSAVANEMFELHGSSLWRHRGTYEEFLDAKQARLEAQGQQAAAARNLYRRELAWVRKQPKARESKSKSRLERFEELKSTVNAAPAPTQAVELEAGMQRLGTSILRFEKARCKRGELTVLDDFSYDFSRGDRIGLVGPNGAGKSSFLLTILQQLPLESGRVIAGETLVYGHYSQEGLELDDAEMRVLAFVREAVAVGHDAQRGDAGRLGAEEAHARGSSSASSSSRSTDGRRRWGGCRAASGGGSSCSVLARGAKRLAARRADERPRPRHAGGARGLPARLQGCAAGGVARPLFRRQGVRPALRPRRWRRRRREEMAGLVHAVGRVEAPRGGGAESGAAAAVVVACAACAAASAKGGGVEQTSLRV